ncbi:MAG TPA: MFS transporter [Acetobacteraceae bacterium]|jgi:predicted MFS family arabinose efflux permease|nr:MFS transporter [Acetobacteraceae bacterium]
MAAGWGELLRGSNLPRSGAVAGGMVIHALNTFIVVTMLPTIVRDIGGLRFFAWNTTLYVVASLIGGAMCARLLARLGARPMYRIALGTFAFGAALCAVAPSMPVLLVGRFLQGMGAGTLSALSFTMVRMLFPPSLWARGLSVISAAWGVATLLGPALGGAFAQFVGWRLGFVLLLAVAPGLLVLVEVALPRDLVRPRAPRTPLAVPNLVILVASVLCVSVGSMAADARFGVLGFAASLAGFAWFVRRETSGVARLLPQGACSPATPLGACYSTQVLLLTAVSVEIFVPYFLQTLHGLVPLHAGYLSALMAGGWTAGSMMSSVGSARTTRAALGGGPLIQVAGLIALALVMPMLRNDPPTITLIGIAMASLGIGIGVCWPHLGAGVFTYAAEGEKDLAASSMTVVIMVANAFASAFGGLVTNMAGLTVPGGVAGAISASSWLFALYAGAPALAWFVTRRLRSVAPPVTA